MKNPEHSYNFNENENSIERQAERELDIVKYRYNKRTDLEEAYAKEIYEGLEETESSEDLRRGVEVLYSRLETQIIINRELAQRLENAIKEKYEFRKNQIPSES